MALMSLPKVRHDSPTLPGLGCSCWDWHRAPGHTLSWGKFIWRQGALGSSFSPLGILEHLVPGMDSQSCHQGRSQSWHVGEWLFVSLGTPPCQALCQQPVLPALFP